MHTPIEARFIGGPKDGTVLILPSRHETVEFVVVNERRPAETRGDPAALVPTEIAVYVVASVGQVVTIYTYDPGRTRPG